MPRDEARRQKKLMRKRRKDKKRKEARAAEDSAPTQSERRKILGARELPVYECLINPSWQEHGLAHILLSRRQTDGNLLYGVYLTDVYCLGLKNTFCNANFTISRYKRELRNKLYQEETPVDCPLPLAHTIIYGGIEYAAQFGFEPNEDFELTQYVLDARESVELCKEVEFGKDGKPFFVAGPHDDVKRIMRQLDSKAGEGNFDFMHPI